MSHRDEVAAGIAVLEETAKQNGCNFSYRRFENRWVYYFKVSRADRFVDFTLSEEFLAHIPGTPQHRTHVIEAFGFFGKRLHSPFPNGFYAQSGIPFKAELHWPLNAHPSRDVIWLRATVEDVRNPDLVAKTAPVISGWLEEAEFKFYPFKRLEAVIDGIRRALDRSELEFHTPGQHPSTLQEIIISELSAANRVHEAAIQQFLAAKVYWLAFQSGGKNSLAWISDPWDATYLGVSTRELQRAAEVLQARRLIRLSDYDRELASAEDALIAQPMATQAMHSNRPIGFAPG